MLQCILFLFFATILNTNTSMASEDSQVKKVRFLLSEPPQAVLISQSRFDSLKSHSKVIQDMPESDEAYTLQDISPDLFDRLCTIATIESSRFPSIETYKNYLVSEDNKKSSDISDTLFLNPDTLKEEQKDCCKNISGVTLAQLIKHADYLQMDKILDALMYTFVVKESTYSTLTQNYKYSEILSYDLVKKIRVLSTFTWSHRLMSNEAFARPGKPFVPNKYALFSPSGSFFITIFNDAVRFKAIRGTTPTKDIELDQPRAVACNKQENSCIVQTINGTFYLASIGEASLLKKIGDFPPSKQLAFDEARSQAVLMYDTSYTVVNLKTHKHVTKHAPDGYMFIHMSAFGDMLGLSHKHDKSHLVLARIDGTYHECISKPLKWSADGRFAVFQDASGLQVFDFELQKVQKLYVPIILAKYSAVNCTFSTDSSFVLINFSQNSYKPVLAAFERETGLCKQYIVSIDDDSVHAAHLQLQGKKLIIYDNASNRLRVTDLFGALALPLHQQYLMTRFQANPEYAYLKFKEAYEKLPKEFRNQLPEISWMTRALAWLSRVF